ncbi:MAG: ribonuclease P protein component [Candidatus Moranbacteria bacterium]|nr:ribonuclease P protein component [Candidatus Moranbacteria bacterium]
MFAKKYRISKDDDFNKVFRNGKSFYGDFFMVKVLKNNLELNRFAVVVSKKVSLKAVERNGIKRKLREVLKKNVNLFPENCDVIIYVNKSILGKSFNEIEDKLKGCFRK